MNNVYYRNKGGIGNQLFMYFTAKSISLKFNKKLVVDNTTGFQNDFYKRVPSISFVVNDEFFIANKFINFLFKVNKWMPDFILFFFGIYTIIETNSNELVKFDKNKLAKYPIILIEGYFQSYLYFEEFREEILKSVLIDFKINSNYNCFIDSIIEKNSVAIHVRRVQYDNLLSLDYYLKAIDFIKNNIEKPHFFIFSDDIEWCLENFIIDNFTFIKVKETNEIQELYLMSLCKSHIIANSSFSWWGAFLSINENNQQIVVAPKLVQIGVTNFFLPKHWVLY
ncbi:MAG: alpha-1,2-fucosyltransferase [Flavobacterium sp.]